MKIEIRTVGCLEASRGMAAKQRGSIIERKKFYILIGILVKWMTFVKIKLYT